MEKAKIFFDFDETLVKSLLGFVETYKEKHNEEIYNGTRSFPVWEYITSWNMLCEMPDLQIDELNEIFDSPRLFDHLAFYADSSGMTMKDVLYFSYMLSNIETYIASKGNPKNLELKREFIQMKLPFFTIDNFIAMKGTIMNKSELHGLALFDDHESNLYSANVKYKVLVNFGGKQKEWNKNAMHDDEILKCTTVREVYEALLSILERENLK